MTELKPHPTYMNLKRAKEVLARPLVMGDREQLAALEFKDKAKRGADEVMKLVAGESNAELVKAIIWLVRKRWNDSCGMDQYI